MFDSIKSFLKQNRAGTGILAVALAAAIGMFLISGCKVTDWVQVDVPAQVQKATGVAPRVTLTEAPEVMEDYVRYGDRFAVNIDEANERLAWFMSIADIGMRIGAAQLPAGGFALAALTGLGGLLLKGPGTAKEKEKSYAKGKTDAEATLLPLLAAAGITVPPKEDSA